MTLFEPSFNALVTIVEQDIPDKINTLCVVTI